jgi:Predicted Zn-dependent protease (DUF2268)
MDRSWTLHWLQAAGTLAPWRPRIRAEIEAAFQACAAVVRPPRVDIVIHQIPHWPVPELGFGGSSPSRTTMFLAFDTNNPDLEPRLQGGLRRVVLHEAHHCLRHAGPGYGRTLAEALVSEGLADRFVEEVLGGDPDPWCVALDENELQESAARAEPVLWQQTYDHPNWFLGSHDGRMTRWAGHSLGWRLIGTFMELQPGARPSKMVNAPAETVIDRAWSVLRAHSMVQA